MPSDPRWNPHYGPWCPMGSLYVWRDQMNVTYPDLFHWIETNPFNPAQQRLVWVQRHQLYDF